MAYAALLMIMIVLTSWGDQSRHTEAGESGLGLAIVKTLVEAHGGTVTAESTPGQGITVRVRLPAGA